MESTKLTTKLDELSSLDDQIQIFLRVSKSLGGKNLMKKNHETLHDLLSPIYNLQATLDELALYINEINGNT